MTCPLSAPHSCVRVIRGYVYCGVYTLLLFTDLFLLAPRCPCSLLPFVSPTLLIALLNIMDIA